MPRMSNVTDLATSAAPRRPLVSGREQILDAAAMLISENGFSATSTRAIAQAAGMRQQSLYHHFATKDEILAALLEGTVTPSLDFDRQIEDSSAPAHVQLYALAYFDISLLANSRANVGTLYQLPEVRSERFPEFRAARDQLRNAYARRIERGVTSGVFKPDSSLLLTTELVFAYVESAAVIRTRNLGDLAHLVPTMSDGCLRLLGCAENDIEHAEVAARSLLAAGFRAADTVDSPVADGLSLGIRRWSRPGPPGPAIGNEAP